MQNIPSSNIDSYSESINGAFEPRESVKGNIARSVFYFYTMYQDDADAADPNFFPAQRPTLCEWHLADVVDEAELMRSARVAQHQDGKENPFVLDCTAALRAWCPEYEGCMTSITTSNNEDGIFQLSAYAIEGHIIVNIISEHSDNIQIYIHDISGRMLISEQLTVTEGVTEFSPLMQFVPGMYIISSITDSGNSQMYITRCTVR